MASAPSDVLAVELLQRVAGQPRAAARRAVVRDRRRSGGAPVAMMSASGVVPWYRERIGGHQEVMIGYSDSAKDAGRFSAAWVLYRAQEEIVAACERHGIGLTLFHGRGGSIGRGGGPTYLAIQSQPPQASNAPASDHRAGRDDRGEVRAGRHRGPRTLEVYTPAMLEATVAPPPAPRAEWRDAAGSPRRRRARRRIAPSCTRPRGSSTTFAPRLRSRELGAVNIGSRPARRPARRSRRAGVESRCARFRGSSPGRRRGCCCPPGSASRMREPPPTQVREMYAHWPFFRSTIDLIAIALAEADPRIAAQYDRYRRSCGRSARSCANGSRAPSMRSWR